MKNSQDVFKTIISHAKAYGFIFPSSEIYGGIASFYDYGPLGVNLKQNLKDYWWKAMTQMHSNIVGIDSSILMHPSIWKASGHVDAFSDPLIDNKDSKHRYRADHLIEEYCLKIEEKIEKEIQKANKRFGENFEREKFISTDYKVNELKLKIESILKKMNSFLKENDLGGLKNLIEELEITDSISGSKNWTEVRQFNLMFETQGQGPSTEIPGASQIYLRPETAQGIFVNFLNVQKSTRLKIPFGIAQIGKAFRNEIIARQFIFRMREFEQMEMQFFIAPGGENNWYEYWKETRLKWHLALGLGKEKYKISPHEKLAHYAKDACDIEFEFPFGFKELEGIHSRSDFDLKNHKIHSGKKLQYFDPEKNESYIPYVIETSVGLDRLFLAVFSAFFKEEALPDGFNRIVLKFPPALSPIKAAILPLIKKEELVVLAKEIFESLKLEFTIIYDEKESIGKRYRRQDAIGTPFCITIDHESLENQSVTIRYRDSMEQMRIPIKSINEILQKETSLLNLLKMN